MGPDAQNNHLLFLSMRPPEHPKLYHIVHVDRLPSIVADGALLSDGEMSTRASGGTIIGMSSIKQRRLKELCLERYPDLHVGECVPFYFCPRSIMLYLIHKGNHECLEYRGGQEPVIHLEADLHQTVSWAESQEKRWAFTLSNAGAYYVESRYNLDHLHEINWTAVNATNWSGCKESKQAEFLVEQYFPLELVNRIGVYSNRAYRQVTDVLSGTGYNPVVEMMPGWYY